MYEMWALIVTLTHPTSGDIDRHMVDMYRSESDCMIILSLSESTVPTFNPKGECLRVLIKPAG